MNNIDSKSLVEKINNSLVVESMSINQIAKMLKVKRNEIFEIMKKENFIYDREQGFFVKVNNDSLIKRIERLEEQQKEILELLSSTKKETLKIDSSVLEGDIIPRTFKLYKNTSEKFTKFCNNHRELKMQEIITVALEEFMLNHK
ncbi:phage antirepressor KilAC domain-containing protein [Clostridium perfringens]|uniref:phage antirepressor KilAC domain-containing protein n=1 Tax=Clostridium perfringens TaxID=1502 RepID=UPI001F05EA94|nr:phage antirepressor KilAC domain-containing protein [Clostridium perfringens]